MNKHEKNRNNLNIKQKFLCKLNKAFNKKTIKSVIYTKLIKTY